MPIALFSSAYMPPVSYFAFLWKSDRAWIEQCEHYHKQSYRNRCVIASGNGPVSLTVPVEHRNDHPIRDIRIDYREPWQRQHWNSIESAYRSSPFFDYYRDDFQPLFDRKFEFLFDLNEALLSCLCESMDIHPNIEYTPDFQMDYPSEVLDLRDLIHPKRPVELPGYRPRPYTQVFDGRYGFQEELSALDLLMNMGPESILVIRDSFIDTQNV